MNPICNIVTDEQMGGGEGMIEGEQIRKRGREGSRLFEYTVSYQMCAYKHHPEC